MSEEMIQVEVNWMELFFPEYLQRKKIIQEAEGRFAYYTSADTAMQVLKKKEVWLRNARSMNDFSEVEHGFNCFRDVFLNSEDGKALQFFLEENYPGIVAELARRIDGWMPVLRAQTYILCVSEHADKEDDHGRLSMWRAYGGKTSVAIILKNGLFCRKRMRLKPMHFPCSMAINSMLRGASETYWKGFV